MTVKETTWSTNYPTSQDIVGTEQPDLTNDTTPGALDGDRIRNHHFHSLRDKLQSVAQYVGDTSNLPGTSLRARVTSLESAPALHASTHEPGGSDAMAVDAAAGTGSLRTLGTGAAQACAGNDSRLSDARTPTSHASTHEPGGSDTMAVDAVAGTGSLRTLGTGATQACAGNDSRLSDARTPTSHASTHQSGGSDAIKLDDLASPDDNTDLNVSTSAHGLCPKLSNVVTEFLNGQGGWTVPAGGGGGGTPNEEEFSTDGTEDPGDSTTFGALTNTPTGSGTANTPSGYDILVFRNGVKMKYDASPSTYNHYFYDSVNNEIDVLASGDADDYEVVYGS